MWRMLLENKTMLSIQDASHTQQCEQPHYFPNTIHDKQRDQTPAEPDWSLSLLKIYYHEYAHKPEKMFPYVHWLADIYQIQQND
jgi:hypothetical protein